MTTLTPTAPTFRVGETYETVAGNTVTMTAQRDTDEGRQVRGCDGLWRWDRDGDRGRCASNLVPVTDGRNLRRPYEPASLYPRRW